MAEVGGRPQFPTPPDIYDRHYFSTLVRMLSDRFRLITNPGKLYNTTAEFTEMPTSGSGLGVGELYNANGFVKIVRSGDVWVLPSVGSMTLTGLAPTVSIA